MNVQSLNLDLANLQQQTITSLEKVKEFISNEQDITIIDNQLKRVTELELRIAIVGSMKSGKSTLINALIGRNIMPSHSDAMTALPTDIILDNSLSQPVFILSDIDEFTSLISTLKTEINTRGIAGAKNQMSAYPHLHNLLDKIASGKFQVSPETFGVHEIRQTLTELNHLIRLSELTPNHEFFQKILNTPTIKTSFWRGIFGNSENSTTKKGRLVIVDTPGGDEAGQNQLETMVNSQLNQASMALVIVNYRTLRNLEADNIRNKVNQLIELVGKNNLYIVVNQIDARRASEGYLTQQQVLDVIRSQFDINQDKHIFEVSSLWAFRATNLLQILQLDPTISNDDLKRKSETLEFAEEYYGIQWEDTLNGITKQELEQAAERLWAKSGFANLLQAILALLPQAEHRCLRTAINTGINSLDRLDISWSDEFKKVREFYKQLHS